MLGHDVAGSVLVHPEGVTVTCTDEACTVKQAAFASIDKPAVILLRTVDAIRPMEIIASFVHRSSRALSPSHCAASRMAAPKLIRRHPSGRGCRAS